MPVFSKTPKLIEVVWKDVLDTGGDWYHEDKLPEPVTVKTIGYVLADKTKHIVLMRDFYFDHDKGVAGGVITIPKGMIVKINDVSIVTSKSKKS